MENIKFKAEQRDKFSVSERIKFLEEASALEEKITNQEIEAARLRFEAKKAENALSKSTKEDLELEAQLQADLIALETARLTKQKEVTGQIIALRTEEQAKVDADKLKAEADKQKELDDEAAFTLAQREALAISEEEKTALLVTKAQERFDALIEQAKKFKPKIVKAKKGKGSYVRTRDNKNKSFDI